MYIVDVYPVCTNETYFVKVTVNLRDHVAEKAPQAHSFKVKYPNLYFNLKLKQ